MRRLGLGITLSALLGLGCRESAAVVAETAKAAPTASVSAPAPAASSAAPMASASASARPRRVSADCKPAKYETKNEKLRKVVGEWSASRGDLTLRAAGAGLAATFGDGDPEVRWTVTAARFDGETLDVRVQSSLPNGLRLAMKLRATEPDVLEGTTTASMNPDPVSGGKVEPQEVAERYERRCP
jgi:hypothetical protein